MCVVVVCVQVSVQCLWRVSGFYRGRLVLRTVNEEDDFTKFHNDHVENNAVDGMERNQAQSRRSENSSTETTSDVVVTIARMPGEEHSDRNTAKVETERFQGDGHHARFPHLVTEAGFNRVTCQQQHERSLKRR